MEYADNQVIYLDKFHACLLTKKKRGIVLMPSGWVGICYVDKGWGGGEAAGVSELP